MKKIIIPLIIIAVLAVGGYFGVTYWLNQRQANALSNYLTETVGRGNLTSLIGGTGTVKAARSVNLTWQTSGNVGEVGVQEGDSVSADEVLASLDANNLPASILSAQAELINAEKQLDMLQRSDLATVQAAQAISETEKSLIEARKLFDEEYDTDQYQNDIDNANEEVVTAEDDLDEAKKDLEPYLDRDKDNTTRKSYQDKVDSAQTKYDEAKRKYDLLVLNKSIASQNVQLLEKQLDDAKQKYEDVKNGADPRDVAALQARIDAAQATLDNVDITAPFAGTITKADVESGDPVNPGQFAFRLDDLSQLLVDVKISEVDINNIAIGQDVRLSFDAIQGKEYSGRVSEVSSIGVPTQGVVEFLVTIEVLDADEDVKIGMTAAVNIVVETLENVLLVPNRAVRSMEGDYVVYVIENSELVKVTIELGANSDTTSEVVGGNLSAGDTLVLNPPVVFDTNGPPPFARQR
jgi:HlyD family secretion protein